MQLSYCQQNNLVSLRNGRSFVSLTLKSNTMKIRNIEMPIGGIIRINEHWLKCVRVEEEMDDYNQCLECSLLETDLCRVLDCVKELRKDGLSVNFKYVEGEK